MLRNILTILVATLAIHAHAAPKASNLPLIPYPQKVVVSEGHRQLPNKGTIFGKFAESAAAALNDQGDYQFTIPTAMDELIADILVKPLDGATDELMARETYVLSITENQVTIYANTAEAAYRAGTTLRQLVDHASKPFDEGADLPLVEVTDSPRFEWRGYMLDESRHFSGVDAVKRTLDAMAYYKLNVFHWHLTDSQGWRVEIKKYPKLTTIGAIGTHTDPEAPAQFYTQKQIKEIVAYAEDRHIKVIPEIDMPGHAAAAVRAYPEHGGGGSKKHPDFTFNPANSKTREFLSDILAEIAELFPDAKAIHFGGDEVHFGWEQWPNLPDVTRMMQEQDLPDLRAVEKLFAQRTAKTINDLGFSAAGWDEIVDFELDPEKSLVFWWRHDKPKLLTQALENGFDVVMCPRRPLYFDFVQHGSHKVGRRWGGFCPLEDVYAFPDNLKEFNKRPKTGHVMGIQANLWTETAVTQQRRDFLTFPRLLAVAESGWTEKNNKSWDAFYNARLKPHLPHLEARGLTVFNPYEVSDDLPK